MGVRGWESVSALHPMSRWVVVFGIFLHVVTVLVNADRRRDDDRDKDKSDEEDREYCEKQCPYGCCDNIQCCDPHPKVPSFTVKVIAVVGACLVILLLLFLCIVRYRMAARIVNSRPAARTRRAGDVGRSTSSTTSTREVCPSVCSRVNLNLRGSQTRTTYPWSPLRTILLDDHCLSTLHTPATGGQMITPPPYSELDLQEFSFRADQLPPPPYDEVVKESEGVTGTTPEGLESSSSSPESAPAPAPAQEELIEQA